MHEFVVWHWITMWLNICHCSDLSWGSLGKDSTFILLFYTQWFVPELIVPCQHAELVDRLLAVDWDSPSSSPWLSPTDKEQWPCGAPGSRTLVTHSPPLSPSVGKGGRRRRETARTIWSRQPKHNPRAENNGWCVMFHVAGKPSRDLEQGNQSVLPTAKATFAAFKDFGFLPSQRTLRPRERPVPWSFVLESWCDCARLLRIALITTLFAVWNEFPALMRKKNPKLMGYTCNLYCNTTLHICCDVSMLNIWAFTCGSHPSHVTTCLLNTRLCVHVVINDGQNVIVIKNNYIWQ